MRGVDLEVNQGYLVWVGRVERSRFQDARLVGVGDMRGERVDLRDGDGEMWWVCLVAHCTSMVGVSRLAKCQTMTEPTDRPNGKENTTLC